jgi:hypothetical protein
MKVAVADHPCAGEREKREREKREMRKKGSHGLSFSPVVPTSLA